MKARYIIYCALIALAVFSAQASADCNTVIVGDANSDGRITTADSMLALRMAVGSMPPDIERADVNHDGEVNSLDALMILTIAQKAQVCVNAPEVVSGAFNVTIDIYNVVDLDSGQFDLSFDPSVVNVSDVHDGNIGGTAVPISDWRFMDADTIRVLFDLPDADLVSGSGALATISFEITGAVKDESVLDISNGELFDLDTYSEGIPATWTDCEVTIGVPVMVNAPKTVSDAFNATIDIENVTDLDSGQFDLSFDSSVVNVSEVHDGNIGGTTVPISDWRFMDADTIRVLFDLPDADLVTGAGSLVTVNFEMTGVVKDTSVLDISNGELFDLDTYGEGIPAIWNDCDVTIGVPVTVNAPEIVSGDTFDATIDVADVTNLTSGQFDLSFDPSVVNVTSVDSGSIAGTEVHMDMWRLMDDGRVRVLFRCPSATMVSGSGSLATIHFMVTGTAGATSVLDISDVQLFGLLLVDYTNFTPVEIHEIPAIWNDCEVTIGESVTVNAPEIVSDAFNATIDIENVTDLDSGQFDLSFDSSVVNVSEVHDGNIGGTTVPISDWRFMDADTIRVLFDLPDADLVSGAGSLATIDFEITGSVGDSSVLDISNGELFDLDTYSDGIPATWTDCTVTV